MRKLTLIFVAILIWAKTFSNSDSLYRYVCTYINPVLPGDHPDPTLLKVGDDFYFCGSCFHFTPYLTILHSKDLIHWKEISRVVPSNWSGLISDAPSNGIWQGAITYFYGSFWIYFSNTAGGGQYFCKAQNPAGPWSLPVKVQTTSETGASGYDNSIFVDDDGTPYMLIKAGQYVNRIQKIGPDGHLTGPVINLDWINKNARFSWAEGPVMCKRDGWYYYFIAGHVWGGQYVWRTRQLTSDSTQWEYLGNVFAPITDPNVALRYQNHMTAPIQLSDGTWWTIAQSYEKLNTNDWSGQGRQGTLHQIVWDENGKPTATAPTLLPLIKPNLTKNEYSWKLPRSDYFDNSKLSLSWHFLNKNASTKYNLSERPGWLRLKPISGRTHILQKDAGHYYTIVTKVDVNPISENQGAGIYLTNGNESVVVKLFQGYKDGKKIIFTFNNETTYEVSNIFGSNVVWLKLDRREHDLYGYYSIDGLTWIQVGSKISAVNLDKEQPNYNYWVGNSQGLFAENIQADFDLYFYRDGFSELPLAGYNNQYGITTISTTWGKVVTNNYNNGGWLMIGGVELGNENRVPVKLEIIASSTTGGIIEIWKDDIERNGSLIASINVSSTGGTTNYMSFISEVSDLSGQHDIYIRFSAPKNSIYIRSLKFIPDSSFYSNTKDYNLDKLIKVYPNPFNEYCIIDLLDNEGKYFIYDLNGNLCDSNVIKNYKIEVGKELRSGTYLLILETFNNRHVYKLIKK